MRWLFFMVILANLIVRKPRLGIRHGDGFEITSRVRCIHFLSRFLGTGRRTITLSATNAAAPRPSWRLSVCFKDSGC